MKRKDETNKHLVNDGGRSSVSSHRLSNRLNPNPSETGENPDDINEFRHGYGI